MDNNNTQKIILQLQDGRAFTLAADSPKAKEVVTVYNDSMVPGTHVIEGNNIKITKADIKNIMQGPKVKPKQLMHFNVQPKGSIKEIDITEDELPKALYCYYHNKRAMFRGGVCELIANIVPNKIKTMGWQEGYKLTGEDMRDINNTLGRKLEDTIDKVTGILKEGAKYKMGLEQFELECNGIVYLPPEQVQKLLLTTNNKKDDNTNLLNAPGIHGRLTGAN